MPRARGSSRAAPSRNTVACRLRSVSEPQACGPGARNGDPGEVEATVRRGRRETWSVLPEQVPFWIIPGVVRPRVEIASAQRELDPIGEVTRDEGLRERVGRGHLTKLHERAVFHVLAEDAEATRKEAWRQLAGIAVRQELGFVFRAVERRAQIANATGQIHDVVAEAAIE